jgi:hypothetical protein
MKAGGKIIESNDVLIELEQRLNKIRADETRGTGDEPAAAVRF